MQSFPKRRPNQCALTDKQVVKLIWDNDMESTSERVNAIVLACTERGIKADNLNDKSISELLEICGHRY